MLSPEILAHSSSSIDWLVILLAGSYFLIIFILLAIVIYTNIHTDLFSFDKKNKESKIYRSLTEDERNLRTSEILFRIEELLTPVKGNNGEELVTITRGFQNKFMKKALDYINKHLIPTSPEINERLNEFAGVYNERCKRVFSGSYWITGASIAVSVLIFNIMGFNTFLIIHIFGLLFYFLSCRTTAYDLENRVKIITHEKSGLVRGVFATLFSGMASDHYIKHGNRNKSNDRSSVNTGLYYFIFILSSIVLGFFTIILGLVNFLLNYSTSFFTPFSNEKKWYNDHFQSNAGFE